MYDSQTKRNNKKRKLFPNTPHFTRPIGTRTHTYSLQLKQTLLVTASSPSKTKRIFFFGSTHNKMKMTTESTDKKVDGLNINARVFIPGGGGGAPASNPNPWATASGNTANNNGQYVNGVFYPSGAPQQQQQQRHHYQQQQQQHDPNADYECDPDAYGDEGAGGGYGYYDEEGNFIEVEGYDEDGDDSDDDGDVNGGMDSDEEAWMMEQIMKGEDEHDRVHGVVRDEKGNIVSVGGQPVASSSGNACGDSNKSPATHGAVSEATAQAFARRCVEADDSDSEEGEPEFEE